MHPSTPDDTSRIEMAITQESASHFFLQSVRDEEASGVFIATERPLGVGEQVGIELSLHAYVLYFRGTVRFRTPAGVGVTFGDISAPARRVIEAFCTRRRAPVVYDDAGGLVAS
jgi:hypothetical protein